MEKAKKKTTIVDVAKLADVSTATVSKVLNCRPGVSKETKAAVNEAIDKLNYQRNYIARGLRMNRTFTIGIVTDDIEGVFTIPLVRGIEDGVRPLGYNVFLCNSYGQRDLERNNIEALIAKQVDGLIMMSGYKVSNRDLPAASTHDKPILFLYQYSNNGEIPSIIPDDFQGGKIATKHLTGLGHKKIGVIAGPLNFEAVNLRLEGYKKVLKEHDIQFDPVLVQFNNWNQKAAYQTTIYFLSLSTPPSAIFCMSDIFAIGAAQAVSEAGLRIPDDISLVGFDNRFFSENQVPALTTVELPFYDMGLQAGQLLHKMISEDVIGEKNIVVPCKLIIRDSTAAAINE
jgi:DNA-binding LacI/PurR family transcriptional regulator